MKKDESMKEIEQLLELAPEVKDMRTKEELFARLKKEGVFDESTKSEEKEERANDGQPVLKPQKGSRIATIVVAAVALLTFGGMGGYLLSQNNSAMDEASSGSDMATLEMADEQSMNSVDTEEMETKVMQEATSYIPNSALVWESDLQWANQLKLGLVTEQLDVVPVTVLIDQDHSPSNVTTYLELYNRYAVQIDEEALGFISYHPMEGTFKESDGELTHVLPNNHSYDTGSASEYLYGQVLNQTFSPAFLHVNVVNEDGSPVEFAHTGLIDQIGLPPLTKQLYFVTEITGERYITPSYEMRVENVELAMQQLSEPNTNSSFESPIVSGVTYSTNLNSDVVIVTFAEALNLSTYDPAQVTTMLDAMIMTAASYGMRIQFENVLGAEGFSYPVGEPIEKPIGANKIILNSN